MVIRRSRSTERAGAQQVMAEQRNVTRHDEQLEGRDRAGTSSTERFIAQTEDLRDLARGIALELSESRKIMPLRDQLRVFSKELEHLIQYREAVDGAD